MAKSIFLIEASGSFWIQVAAHFRALGVEIKLWTAWSAIRSQVQQTFPETQFHDSHDAKRGLDPFGSPMRCGPFDEVCERVWREEAQTVYDMMNRFDFGRDQSFVERSTLFLEQLTYWRNFITLNRPDLIIFSTPPHVVFDYIILSLARKMGIKTLMFEEATIFPPYSVSMRDYMEGAEALHISAPQSVVMNDDALAIVERIQSSYRAAKPPREVAAHEQMRAVLAAGHAGLLEEAAAIKARDEEMGGEGEPIFGSGLYKERGQSLRKSFEGPYASSRWIDQAIRESLLTMEMSDYYHTSCTKLSDIDRPYIYVPLAGQPERTSNPQAGIYCNQLIMVNQIAHSVPDGWAVVVKEHPNQFHPKFAVNMCRDKGYYESLLGMPNVQLVATSEDPFELIDRAVSVCTSGGTSTLEAAIRGKPAGLFGDAWYRHCPGVHRMRKLADVQDFVRKLAAGLAGEAGEAALFVALIAKVGFRGIADVPPANYPVSEGENVASLIGIVAEALGLGSTQ